MKPIVRAAALSATLLAVAPSSGRAQSSLGLGNLLCGDYIRAARTSDILYHQASNWLLGYYSGMNAAARGVGAPVGLTSEQVLKSAGDFCEANPGSAIVNAAGQWTAALPRQAVTPSQGSLIINLDRAPDRRPLLERR